MIEGRAIGGLRGAAKARMTYIQTARGLADMTLDYIALVILVVVIALVVYGVVAVYGIPYEIAKARNHPHQDAIGAATWVSLFTLGALWPLLWIWAMAYRPDRGWGFSGKAGNADATRLAEAISRLETRLAAIESAQQKTVT